MLTDLRFAWRFLAHRKATTCAAVLTLAVAIAGCTLAAGVLDRMFWRPLDAGAGLVTLYQQRAAAPSFMVLAGPDYRAVREALAGEVDLAAFVRVPLTLGGGDAPARVSGELVSDNYFDVQGARPALGRWLTGTDERAAAGDLAVVLGHDLWVRTFGSDPSIVGRRIRLGRGECTIGGVAGAGFHGPAYRSEFWMPLAAARRVFEIDVLQRADAPILQTVGRPRPGVSLGSLDAHVRALSTNGTRDGWTLTALPAEYLRFWPAYRPALARFLGIFTALALCLFIVACSNLAGLALARGGERQRELALREALGAGRAQLLRRLAAENIIVVATGGSAGLLAATWTAPLVEQIPTPVPVIVGVTPDWRLMAIGAAISVLALVLFTALSASSGLSASLRSILAASGGGLSPVPRMQRLLAAGQVAMCTTLVTAALLLGESAFNVNRIDVGFDPANRVIGLIALGDQGYTPEAATAFYRRLQAALAARPEVEAAALEWNAIASPIRSSSTLTLPGGTAVSLRYNIVSPGYFTALGIAMRAGREFADTDDRTGELVAIVNESLAARFTSSPVGQTVSLPNEAAPRRVIGVARDVAYNGVTEPAQPFVYLPLAQALRSDLHVHVHLRGGAVPGLLRETVRTIDPRVAVVEERTLMSQLDLARAVPRASATISAGAAAFAVILALVGLYAVLMASVDRRARELAIRAALGAQPAELMRSVALEGAAVTVVGLALGIAGSAGAGRVMSSLLFGVSPSDVPILATVAVVVATCAAAASLQPARRAAHSDPAGLLKG